MNEAKIHRLLAGIDRWKEDFGQGMEYRGADGLSWYDLSINANSLPCEPKLAVIVTAWAGQLKWLSATLESYRKTGAFVILAFDQHFYPWGALSDGSALTGLPSPRHFQLANSVVFKHLTYDANKRNGWFWSVRYAQGILKQFPNIEYVYLTKPTSFAILKKTLDQLIAKNGINDRQDRIRKNVLA